MNAKATFAQLKQRDLATAALTQACQLAKKVDMSVNLRDANQMLWLLERPDGTNKAAFLNSLLLAYNVAQSLSKTVTATYWVAPEDVAALVSFGADNAKQIVAIGKKIALAQAATC